MTHYRRNLISALATTLLALQPVTAHAASEQQAREMALDDARAILTAAKTEEFLDTMFVQIIPVMESAFVGRLSASSPGSSLLDEVDAKYPGGRQAFGKRFGEIVLAGMRAKYPAILEDAAHKYVEELTPEDLRAARTFYETQSGARLLAAQPKLQAQLSDIGQQIGRQVGGDAADTLLSEAEKYLGEIK